MIFRTILFSLFLLLALPAMAQEKKETALDRVLRTGVLRCGYLPWPNFFETDFKTGQLVGVYKDITDRTLAIIGLKVEYHEVVLGQQVQDLKNGRIDAMCGEGPWIIDTVKYVSYSDPVAYTPVYAFGRSDSPLKTRQSLNDPKISFVGIDSDLSTQLAQWFFSKAQLKTLPNTSNADSLFLNVSTRKADITIADGTAFAAFDKNNPGKIKDVLGRPLAVYPTGFAVNKDEQALKDTLSEAVKAALNTGLIGDILNKFDPDQRIIIRSPTVLKE